jgi:hypothetical protein
MFTLLVAITVLTVFYGLVWHDQPAKEREKHRQGTGAPSFAD